MSEKMVVFDDSATAYGAPDYGPQCTDCVHRQDGRRCDAFEYIPDAIWLNRADHRKPYPGDHGIRFAFPEKASKVA